MNIWDTISSNGWYIVYGVVGLLGLFYFFRHRAGIYKFFGEVRVELEKCSWPWDPNQTGFKKYKELRDSTVVVILSVILLAGFVTSSDFLLTHLVGFLTGTGLAHLTTPASPLHS
jgi:preprotein translocase subunit SecE